MTIAQSLSSIGLILDVIGAVIFIVDSNRLSGLLAGMVKHIAEDHGRFDSKKFTTEEVNDLQRSTLPDHSPVGDTYSL